MIETFAINRIYPQMGVSNELIEFDELRDKYDLEKYVHLSLILPESYVLALSCTLPAKTN